MTRSWTRRSRTGRAGSYAARVARTRTQARTAEGPGHSLRRARSVGCDAMRPGDPGQLGSGEPLPGHSDRHSEALSLFFFLTLLQLSQRRHDVLALVHAFFRLVKPHRHEETR